MAIFDDLGKKLTDSARGLQEKAKQGVESGKILYERHNTAERLKEAYAALGKYALDQLRLSEDSVMLSMVRDIDFLEERIREMDEQLAAKKPGRCPVCGNKTGKDDLFCKKCGTKLDR